MSRTFTDLLLAEPPSLRVGRLRNAHNSPARNYFARRSAFALPLICTKPQKEAGTLPAPASRRALAAIPEAGLGPATLLVPPRPGGGVNEH